MPLNGSLVTIPPGAFAYQATQALAGAPIVVSIINLSTNRAATTISVDPVAGSATGPCTTPTVELVHIDVGSLSGVAGVKVSVPVTIQSVGFGPVSMSNEITYQRNVFELDASRCTINPALKKALTTHIVASGPTATVKVSILSSQVRPDRTPIPDGVVYRCDVGIQPGTRPGKYPLRNTMAFVFGPLGSNADEVGVLAGNGTITVDVGTPAPTPTATQTPAGTRGPCIGDCHAQGSVTVDEVLTMVSIALGEADIASCSAGIASGVTQITVDQILTAVSNALNGCGGG